MSNEKFIKKWGKDRVNGKFKYILTNCIYYAIIFWVVSIIIIVGKGNEFYKLIYSLVVFIVVLISYITGMRKEWNKNEERYNQLLNKK